MTTDKKTIHALKFLFDLEVMAVEIYRTQEGVFSNPDEERTMKEATENERHHRETFRRLLAERGAGLPVTRHLFWLVGQTLGRTTSVLGRKAVLKADAAFENKAVKDYGKFLEKVEFNDRERTEVGAFRDDEQRHRDTWRSMFS